MGQYDSDSSDGEDNYTATNVLLGYASHEPTEDSISHLGGHPTWIDGTAPSGEFAKCKVCNGLLTLLLELNGTLPDKFPDHERRLYIFSCRRKACRRKEGSVRGIRGAKIVKSTASNAKGQKDKKAPAPAQEEKKPQSQIGESLFGVKPSANSPASQNQNPFSTNQTQNQNPFSTAQSKAPKNEEPKADIPAINEPKPEPQTTAAPKKTGTWSNPFDTKYISEEAPNPFEAPATTKPSDPPLSPNSTVPSPGATVVETLAAKLASQADISKSESSETAAKPESTWPAETDFPEPYPYFALDADYETLDPEPKQIPQNARIVDEHADFGEGSGGGGGGEGKEDKEAFESSLDKTFQTFADRLAQNPEQVLRYEFGGTPLLYSTDDAIGRRFKLPDALEVSAGGPKVQVKNAKPRGPPKCVNCGSERVFECQLTPHAITELESEEDGIEGMDWGTLLLGVCQEDCLEQGLGVGVVGYVEEWVGVQWEEVGEKPRQKR